MAAAGEVAAAAYNAQRTRSSDPMVNAADFVPKTLSEISRGNSGEDEPEADLDLETLSGFFGAKKQ